jgi:hypothetical protein
MLFTRLDFLINNSLYNYGLRFDEGWYLPYSLLYALAYQCLILLLVFYARNMKFFAFAEVFVLTSTQDLVYFGLWQNGFPSYEWAWSPFFCIFGNWTTMHQLMLSFSAIFLVSTVLLWFPKRLHIHFPKFLSGKIES